MWSRELLLWNKLCFATTDAPAVTYFDPDIDELYIGAGNLSIDDEDDDGAHAFFQALLPEERSGIKNLVIDMDLDSYFANATESEEASRPDQY